MKGKPLTPKQIQQAGRLKAQGFSYREIASQLDISLAAISEHTKDIEFKRTVSKKDTEAEEKSSFPGTARLSTGAPKITYRGCSMIFNPESIKEWKDKWTKWYPDINERIEEYFSDIDEDDSIALWKRAEELASKAAGRDGRFKVWNALYILFERRIRRIKRPQTYIQVTNPIFNLTSPL